MAGFAPSTGVDLRRVRRGDILPGLPTLATATAGGGSTAAQWVGVVLAAILFGFGHYYKGASGIIDSGVAGLILGAAYMLSGRNLWAAVLAHGLIDTVGVVALYFGWASSSRDEVLSRLRAACIW